MSGYVHISKRGLIYEAVGITFSGWICTSPAYSTSYKKAYMKIYNQLRVR